MTLLTRKEAKKVKTNLVRKTDHLDEEDFEVMRHNRESKDHGKDQRLDHHHPQ